MRKFIICISLSVFGLMSAVAQDSIRGVVYGVIDGKSEPLVGANVFWKGTQVGATTNGQGKFSIIKPLDAHMLVASFLGFTSQTVHVDNQKQVAFKLKEAASELQEVIIRDKQQATSIQKKDVGLTQLITQRELTKAACCNLSESFETNPAIDASYTDAVTGQRTIRLLGLDGPYSFYTRGNVPTLGGMSSVLGLQLIPGSWIQSIQLTKGSGSVVNGYESIAGQVNYELRAPTANEKLYVQLYANNNGRFEQSAVIPVKLSEKWATNFMLYARQGALNKDFNGDGYLDIPQGNMYIFQNTWSYQGTTGWESQFGFKYANNQQTGGQVGWEQSTPGNMKWVADQNTTRLEYWHKLGYVFKSPGRSIGFQWSGTWHEFNSSFGQITTPTYSGRERDVYFNAIFQDIIGTTDHQYKVGASFKGMYLEEFYFTKPYARNESVPGIFAEYTYLFLDKITAVAGLRGDYNSIFGAYATPRLHLRYAPTPKHTFRANVGKAYRTPNLFADNIGSMASSRTWNFDLGNEALPYNGLEMEESINTGISYTYATEWDYRPVSIRAEYFFTTFQNQLVKDWDATAREMNFYNLEGASNVHNAQFQFDYEVVQRLNMRVAYRFVLAQTEYRSIGFAEQPFIDKHRFFANAEYETKSHWKFDATLNWHSQRRLPFTGDNPEEYQLGEQTPSFFIVNAQISKLFREKLEVHIGVENLFDFMQNNPIVAASEPFSENFDASMVWGPVMGRVIYGGIRLRLF
jgi:outer membrane receptor for ferrienterochelin and colicin